MAPGFFLTGDLNQRSDMRLFSAWFGKQIPAEPVSAPLTGEVAPKRPYRRVNEFLALIEQHDEMDPRLATSRAYLQLMIDEGQAGDWEQNVLFGDYEALCLQAQVATMPLRKFWGAIHPLGCRRRQEDTIRKGKRIRPYIVRIPKVLQAQSGNIVPWPEMRAAG